MDSVEFNMAKKSMARACHVRTVLAVVACYSSKLPFDESVELFELAADKLEQIYGIQQIKKEGS